MTGHLFWLRERKQKEKGRRDIGQDSVLATELCGIFGDVNEVDELGGVRGIR